MFLSWLTPCLAQQTSIGGSTYVWFNQIERPCTLNEAQLTDIAAKVRRALKDNAPTAQLVASLPDDHSPRIVFISIGDDTWPARTYFGTGFSFGDALATALNILRDNEQAKKAEIVKQATAVLEDAQREGRPVPREWAARREAPGTWHWLKLHVVQASRPYRNFTFNRSRLAFSDLLGIAFAPEFGFAFTPEQLTGRYLLTPNRFISKKQVGNIIAEAFNFQALSAWLAFSNNTQELTVHRFETDEYYADDTRACRLFRAHPLPTIPDADNCLQAATTIARTLAEHVHKKHGTIAPPFPDWMPQQGGEALDDVAECALALTELANAIPDQDATWRALADRLLKPVREATLAVSGHLAIITQEPLPENSPRQPRTIALLRHNALALLAMLKLNLQHDHDTARKLADFILTLHTGDGTFHNAAILPKGTTIDYQERHLSARLTDDALAACALQLAAQLPNPNPKWLAAAKRARTHLVQHCLTAKDDDLPDIVWLTAALTAPAAPDSRQHAGVMSRIAAKLMTDKETTPVAPDLAGAPKNSRSYLQGAQRAWSASTIALWLKPLAPDFRDAIAAETALPTSFHRQALIDDVSSVPLPRPKAYRGFCRLAPDAYSFSLQAQSWQMLALAQTAKLLQQYPGGRFPDLKLAQAQLDKARAFINVHPGYLGTDAISNHHGVSEEARNTIGQISGRSESKTRLKEGEKLFLYPAAK